MSFLKPPGRPRLNSVRGRHFIAQPRKERGYAAGDLAFEGCDLVP
jgi:hypothetical protein